MLRGSSVKHHFERPEHFAAMQKATGFYNNVVWTILLCGISVKNLIGNRPSRDYISFQGGDSIWIRKDFRKFDVTWGKRKSKWHNCWVLPQRQSRVLSRVGGTSPCILKGRCYFSWPAWLQKKGERRPAGPYTSARCRSGETVRHGNFKSGIFAGLLMVRYVMERCRRAGRRRWKCAESARYSCLCYRHFRSKAFRP